MERDTLDKIIETYFAGITRQTFIYKHKEYKPKDLVVSPLLFRGFTCPPMCGGCCPKFSLDFLPDEKPHQNIKLEERIIDFNGLKVPILSDLQLEHQNHHCKHLNMNDGRCNVHTGNPFSCDFELCRFISYPDKTVLTQKLFGRGWAFLRVDGERGAHCEITPISKENVQEVIRKLKRLKQWADHFKLIHCLDTVIEWAEMGSHLTSIQIPKDSIGIRLSLSLIEFKEPLVRIE